MNPPRSQTDLPSPTDDTDAALMARLAAGESAALDTLVQRHQQRVRSLAMRLIGHWDAADDVAQDAFMRVMRSADSYLPTAAFSTWLYRIVVNLCLDRQRRRKGRQLGLHDEMPQRTSADAEQPLLEQERALAVRREVEALPERQRLAVILHRFQGMSHAEVAEVMGCSESAVESLLVRGYAQLRQRLAQWATT